MVEGYGLAVPEPTDGDAEKFWERVDRRGEDECWPWLGYKTQNTAGQLYGVMPSIGGKRHVRAHRASYRLNNGEVPAGLVVRHKCDNTLCVNPKHLELGTQLDNVRDRENRGRSRYLHGSKHKNAKLSEADVLSIRARVAAGATRKAMAREYGVSAYCIYSVISRGWKHL